DGDAAPRLNDLSFSADEALAHHASLMQEVVRMLCAGIVHGDLSEYNILISADGPVIIDLPQAVDAAGNNHANAMLVRDVDNLTTYFGQFAPALLTTQYAKEIWALYEHGGLHPEVQLTGRHSQALPPVDLESVMREIDDARAAEAARLLRLQELE
ncbi:MAG: RIO1 family regulatory kinase/ATPase, partial [Hyphomicrobium sp.]